MVHMWLEVAEQDRKIDVTGNQKSSFGGAKCFLTLLDDKTYYTSQDETYSISAIQGVASGGGEFHLLQSKEFSY